MQETSIRILSRHNKKGLLVKTLKDVIASSIVFEVNGDLH